MDDIASYKLRVEKALALKIIDIYESGGLTQEDISKTALYLNGEIEKITNKTDLRVFLDSVAARWPLLSEIALSEKEDSSEEKDNELYSGVLALAQNGKIDKAIELAKSNTN